VCAPVHTTEADGDGGSRTRAFLGASEALCP
jgi:hypothetical protein